MRYTLEAIFGLEAPFVVRFYAHRIMMALRGADPYCVSGIIFADG